jgi:hypothetical protein
MISILQPKKYDYIKILWFPRNNGERNAYIGMKGLVGCTYNKGGFLLLTDTANLYVGSYPFLYKRLSRKKHD